MDFRLCPSCKQSVLDDEATECPFCGALMSGKGGGAAKKPASPKPTEKPATAKPVAAKAHAVKQATSATAATEIGEVDPFAVDPTLRKNTPKGLPKPSKTCTHQATCPMCGTDSFVPIKYAGRDIRCLNDACLVGVYKVPLVEQEVVAEKKAGFFQKNWIWMTTAAIVLGGCITAYILIERANKQPYKDPLLVDPNPKGGTNDNPQANSGNKEHIFIADKNNLLDISEEQLLFKLLDELPKETRLASTLDYKATSLQMLTLFYIKLGDITKALETIKTLADNPSYSKSFSIHPYTELAFYSLANNKPQDAETYMGKALNAWNASQNEWHGRYAAAGAIQLIAGLVSTNRIPDAEIILTQLEDARKNKDQVGIESAVFQTAFELGYFDLLVEQMKKLPVHIGNKISMATVQVLEQKGQHAAALAWCDAAKVPADKFVRKLELIRTIAFPPQIKKQEIQIAAVMPLIENLSPQEQALVWANLGRIAYELQQPDVARLCLTKTEGLIEGWQSLAPIPLPNLVDIYFNKYDHQQQIYRATISSLAMSEFAVLEQGLLKSDDAWKHTVEAINLATYAAPDYDLLTSKIYEMENSDAAIRKQLEETLKLKSGQVHNAVAEYRRNLQKIQQEMIFSQRLLSHIMIEAIKSGLYEQAYTWFKEGEGKTMFDKGYLIPEVPGALWIAMRSIKDDNRVQEFSNLKLAGKALPPVDWDAQKLADFYSRVKQFKFIASDLDKNVNTQDQLSTIYTTMYVAKREEPQVLIDWLKEVRSNDEYREKILQYGTAMYAINGKGVSLYNSFMKTTPKADEKLFAIRGLVQALLQKGVKPEAPKAR